MPFGVHIPEVQLATEGLSGALQMAGLDRGERFHDLGCGHGAALRLAAQQFGAEPHGVEILPDVAAACRSMLESRGIVAPVQVGDLHGADVSRADVVLLHLSPAFYDVLAPRLAATLPARSRVVSARWPVPGWKVVDQLDADDASYYLHRPADAAHAISTLPRIERQIPAATVYDALAMRAHADLSDVGVVACGELAAYLEHGSPTAWLARGQQHVLDLRWRLDDLDAGAEVTGDLQVMGFVGAHRVRVALGSTIPTRLRRR